MEWQSQQPIRTAWCLRYATQPHFAAIWRTTCLTLRSWSIVPWTVATATFVMHKLEVGTSVYFTLFQPFAVHSTPSPAHTIAHHCIALHSASFLFTPLHYAAFHSPSLYPPRWLFVVSCPTRAREIINKWFLVWQRVFLALFINSWIASPLGFLICDADCFAKVVNELWALFVNWPRNRDFWLRESSEWHDIEKNGEKRERRTQPYCFILTTFALSNKHDLNLPIVRTTLKYAFLNMRPKIKFAISVVQVIFVEPITVLSGRISVLHGSV